MNTYDGTYEKECEIKDGHKGKRVSSVGRLIKRQSGAVAAVIISVSALSWQMSSSDPFDQQLGMGIDFTFLDENLGFATLAHNGGGIDSDAVLVFQASIYGS